MMQETDDSGREPAPQNILDSVIFGRDLRALRIRRGFNRMEDFTELLRRSYGVTVTVICRDF